MEISTLIIALLSSSVISTVITIVANAIMKRNEENNVEKKALMFLMRCAIDQLGTYYIKRGYASHNEKKELSDSFEVYKSLGGNGYISALMEEVMSLKARKDDEK